MEKLGSLPENEEPFNVKNWRIGRQLGAGLCGHVHVGEKGKRKIAMKVIDLDELHRVYTQYEVSIEQLNKEVKKEVKVLGLLQHPNIVALVDSFRIGNVVYIGMELVDGPDLLSIIPPRGMNEAAARPLFAQICSAVAYCHSRMVITQVIHGDLKPENILMTDNSRMIKLIDFGFSQIYQPGKKSAVIGGTVVYSPPLDREMTFAWDNWACGVILYGMLTHQLPFTQKELLSRTDLVLSVPETSSPELIDLVVSLFAIKARDRATVTQALKSPWVNHIQTSPYPARRQPSLSHPSPVPQVTTKERVNPIKRTRRLFPLLPRWKKDKNSDQRAAQSPTLSQSPDTSPAQSPTMKNQRKNKVNRQVESGDRLGDGPQYSEKGKASSVPSSPRSAILQAKTKRKNQRQLENGDYTVSESDFVTAQKGSCEIQNRSSKQKLPRSGMGSLRGDRRGSNKLKASLDDVWFSLFHPSNPTRDAPSRPEMRTDSSNSSPNSDSSTPCLSSSRSPDSHLNSVVSPIPSKRSKSKKQRSLKISDTSNEEDWESGSPTQEVPQQGIGRKEVEQRLAEAIHQDRTPKRLKDKDRLEMRSMDSNSPINRKKSYTFRNRLVQNATVRSGRTPQDTILPENLADQRKCRSILTPPALSQNFKKPGRRTTVSSFDRERDRDPHFVCTESLFIPSFGSSRSSGCPSPAMSLDNPSPAMSLDETPFSSLPTSPNSLRSPPPSPQNSPQNSPPGSPIQTSLFSPSFAPSFNFTNPSTPSSCSLSSSSTDSTSSSSSFILNSSSLASSCSCSCSTLPPSTSSKSSSSSCSSSSFSIPLPPLTVSRNSFSPLSPLSPVSPISPSASFSSSLTTPSSSFLSSPSPPSSPSSPLSVSPSFSTKVSSSPCQEQWYMDITEKLEHV